jgi:hypothetical protein
MAQKLFTESTHTHTQTHHTNTQTQTHKPQPRDHTNEARRFCVEKNAQSFHLSGTNMYANTESGSETKRVLPQYLVRFRRVHLRGVIGLAVRKDNKTDQKGSALTPNNARMKSSKRQSTLTRNGEKNI